MTALLDSTKKRVLALFLILGATLGIGVAAPAISPVPVGVSAAHAFNTSVVIPPHGIAGTAFGYRLRMDNGQYLTQHSLRTTKTWQHPVDSVYAPPGVRIMICGGYYNLPRGGWVKLPNNAVCTVTVNFA